MKKVTEFWKKLKYWQKGGLIGLTSGVILIFLAFNVRQKEFPILIDILFNEIALHPLDLASHTIKFYGCYTSGCILNAIIVALVMYSLVGIIMGFFYQQIKKLL